MTFMLLALAALVTLAGCATTPRALAPALTPYERARIDHIEGRSAEAWAGWVAIAAGRTGEAPAALAALREVVDEAPLDRAAMGARAALDDGAESAEVVEQIAARLGDDAALGEARARLGASYVARATGRLRAWPFPSAGALERALPVDALGPPTPIRAGWLASPGEGPGLYGFRLEPAGLPSGELTLEVRSEGAFAVAVAGRRVHVHARMTELLPEVARVSITRAPDEPIDLLVIERASRARARVLVRPGRHAPRAAAGALAALDLALADGDVAAAHDALTALEQRADPSRAAIVEDARRRLATIDVTRPPELREAPDDEAGRTEAPQADRPARATSCGERSRLLERDAERLRHRPSEVVALAESTPALVGPCAETALRAGALLVETHQLDAAVALAERLASSLDPGDEVDRARDLLARVAHARGKAPPRPPRPWPPLGPPLADGRALAASAPDPLPPGRLVVLDDWHVHVDAAGRLTLRSHVVACAGDAAATEALGELALPDDAALVLARTGIRSRRGSPKAPLALEPEDIVEKASVSLPALVPGDCAEWAWYRELAPDPRLPAGAFTVPPLHLERADATVARARVTLEVAPGVAPIVAIEPSAAAITEASRPGPRTWGWEARVLAPRVPEPLDLQPEARRLHLRIWGGQEHDAWVQALAAEAELGLVLTPAVAELAARAVGESPRARLEALHRAVVERVERASEGPLANASWAIQRARGERAVVLAAACIAAGLPCDLVVARPLSEGPDTPKPDPDAYAYTLVRARLGPEPLWLDPFNGFMPPGLIPPRVQGVPARVLVGADAPGALSTPRLGDAPAGQGERAVAITIRIASDGKSAIAEGREALDGIYGATWREALANTAPEARRRLLGAIVEQALPGATVLDLELAALGPDAPDGLGPLVWSWRAHVPIESAGGVSRALRLALLPEGLARGTVQLPERTAPLFVNRAADLALEVAVELPPTCTTGPRAAACDWVFVSSPAPEIRVSAPTLFHERLVASAPGRLVVSKTFRLRPSLVAPDAYPTWKDAALASDRADYLQLVFGPLPRTP
ncbi:MAG: hypothetical protein IT385_25915 [Deltaproteobacteria bacterium]|nr:hypothetical protein [Deltaproteobacteria bacterium]